MDEIGERSNQQLFLYFIRLTGVFSIYVSIKELIILNSSKILLDILVVALFYLLFSPLVVTLPSGATWRPGMAFILFSLLYFDYKIVIMVAIPGTILSSWGNKGFLKRLFQTIGHLSIGIFAAGLASNFMNIKFTASILSYTSITICLLAFFLSNRLVAALIVAIQKQRSLLKQILLIKNDLNWGYSCAYILGILMYLMFRDYGIPGILLVIILLITVYQAFTYFQKLKDIEEKVYLDGLTDAESRMSFEEFLRENDGSNPSGIVFMMDLDKFKMINDTYGHNLGDRILQEFVCHIKSEMKRKYRLFRYGGDEFILVVYSSKKDYEVVYGEVSKMLLAQNEIWNKKGLAVAVSFGSAYLSEQDSLENIVRKADKLMYMNKFKKNAANQMNI